MSKQGYISRSGENNRAPLQIRFFHPSWPETTPEAPAGLRSRSRLRLLQLKDKSPFSIRLQPSGLGVTRDLKAATSSFKSLSAGARKQIREGYLLRASAVTITTIIPEPGGRGKRQV